MVAINFKSTIRPVTNKEYLNTVMAIGSRNSIDYPWTINNSKNAKDTYTVGICDCTAGVITNGQSSVMFHLCPTNPKNKNINEILIELKNIIEDKLCNPIKYGAKINETEELHAIIVGSKSPEYSENFYNKLLNFFKQNNVPTSELKNANKSLDIAYKTSKDEFIVTNDDINCALNSNKSNAEILENCFNKVTINDCDEIA